MSDPKGKDNDSDSLRMDKWLWAARFYKTRALAREALDGGLIRVDGNRAKPAKLLRGGETLEIRKGAYLFVVEVLGLNSRRLGADLARKLYRETPESQAARERVAAELKAMSPIDRMQPTVGRPTKRDRRRLDRLTGR